jgi:non-ribosomal peptide synthetase component F
MPETEVFVLNEDGGECEPGVVGEIHVATEHRTLGYFNQP